MRIPRIYQSAKLIPDSTLTLTADAANHLTRVLRLSTGAELRIFNGAAGEFAAHIISINKKEVQIKLGEYFVVHTESCLKIHLGQAISRGEKMDYTIQKAVELGVTQITPLLTERCGVKLSEDRWDKRLQHWRGIIVNACEQCGRDRLPLINEPVLFVNWLAQVNSTCRLVLDPEEDAGLQRLQITDQTITLLIGPEGGLSEREINLTKQNSFVGIKLGPRILRTETAALAAISALQSKWGDFV
jgi:16S rRNA (uracil1498-N3)-methyltransferase